MQPKRPRINPLIFALALAAVLMIWSVFTSGTGMSGGSTMSYSTVVHYFEHNQVTKFTLDRNTSVITLTLRAPSPCRRLQLPPRQIPPAACCPGCCRLRRRIPRPRRRTRTVP